MKVELNRVNEAVHFEATNEAGQSISIDGSPDIGGQNKGPRPMQILLMSLAGCSSMDICSILKKQRQIIRDYKVVAEAERDREQVPAVFKTIHLHFILTGELDEKKVERAISLSVEKYCSVAHMLQKTAKITYDFKIINQAKE